MHVSEHTVATHAAEAFAPPPGHARPHTPQFSASLARLASHPSTAVALQFAKPALHAARSHTPAVQAPTPLGGMHARPHVPQFIALVAVAVSHPF